MGQTLGDPAARCGDSAFSRSAVFASCSCSSQSSSCGVMVHAVSAGPAMETVYRSGQDNASVKRYHLIAVGRGNVPCRNLGIGTDCSSPARAVGIAAPGAPGFVWISTAEPDGPSRLPSATGRPGARHVHAVGSRPAELARTAQRRLRFLGPRGRLHRIPGPPRTVPHLAVLGKHHRHAARLAGNLPGLPRAGQGEFFTAEEITRRVRQVRV